MTNPETIQAQLETTYAELVERRDELDRQLVRTLIRYSLAILATAAIVGILLWRL